MLTASIPAPPRPLADPHAAPHHLDDTPRVDEIGALLLRVGHHDMTAFEDLYVYTVPRVYGRVCKVLVDAEMSAETTQEVFLALWQSAAAQFDPDRGTGMSWVMTLAHRRAVDRVRSEQSRRTRDVMWGIKNQDAEYDQVVDTIVQQAETNAVRAALSSLSEVQRTAIHLAYYEGLTYLEVAHRLSIPTATAKSRIRDGLIRLRTTLHGPT